MNVESNHEINTSYLFDTICKAVAGEEKCGGHLQIGPWKFDDSGWETGG